MADSINNVEDVILVRELPNKTSISGSDLYLSQTNTQSFKLSHSSLIASIPDNDTIKVDPTTNRLKVEGSILKQTYPVGSIYINAFDDRNPREILGFGIWSRIGEGKVLMGEGVGTDVKQTSKSFSIGSSGGEYEHQLTEDEMPSHNHEAKWDNGGNLSLTGDGIQPGSVGNGNDKYSSDVIQSTGGDQSHNNIQPYTTVYMWKREQDIDPDEPIGGTPVSNWVVDTNLFDDINNNHTSLVSSKAVKEYVDANGGGGSSFYQDIDNLEKFDQVANDEYTYELSDFNGTGYDASKVNGVYVECYMFHGGSSAFQASIQTNLGGGTEFSIIQRVHGFNEDDESGNGTLVFIPMSIGQTSFKLKSTLTGNNTIGQRKGWRIVGVSQIDGSVGGGSSGGGTSGGGTSGGGSSIPFSLDDVKMYNFRSKEGVHKGYIESDDIYAAWRGNLPVTFASGVKLVKLEYTSSLDYLNDGGGASYAEDSTNGIIFIDWENKKIKQSSVRKEGDAGHTQHWYESNTTESNGVIMFDTSDPTPANSAEGIIIDWDTRSISGLPAYNRTYVSGTADSNSSLPSYQHQYIFSVINN